MNIDLYVQAHPFQFYLIGVLAAFLLSLIFLTLRHFIEDDNKSTFKDVLVSSVFISLFSWIPAVIFALILGISLLGALIITIFGGVAADDC